MERLKQIFTEISEEKWAVLGRMAELHKEWNEKVNLVSRKDVENLVWHHYAPCLAGVKVLELRAGMRVIDVGTGGGLPGLILAVLWPEVDFTLADSVGKKIRVVEDIAGRLGLRNVRARNVRVEKLPREFDVVTGRAVTAVGDFLGLVSGLVRRGEGNGVVYWKGGSLEEDSEEVRRRVVKAVSLEEVLGDGYFWGKFVVRYR